MSKNNQKKQLCETYKTIVTLVAKQYQNQGLSMSELIAEGNIGLLTANEKYDESRGFKFEAYAVWWIRQSILQGLANLAEGVKGNQLTEREKFILEHSDEEAVTKLGISLKRVKQIRERALQKQDA
jgi:RNA polymerase sigma factor (sigma-70 family)